ncbi:MAG TPA: tetratricopeptide repeat protein [bacterium]|mgnify:CR=1 FL=1|nr:tetratricopeptide repeat protein [bacterium]
MAENRTSLSLWWLVVLEVLALAVTSLAYMLGGFERLGFWWALAVSVTAAGAVFIVLSLISHARTGGKRKPLIDRNVEPVSADERHDEYLRVGRQLLAEERFVEATAMFEKILDENSSHWQAYNYLGLTYSKRGLYEEAKAVYEKAISLEYDYASAHFNLAIAHEKLGEAEAALERWRRYIDVGQAVGERPDLLEHAQHRIKYYEAHLRDQAQDEVYE